MARQNPRLQEVFKTPKRKTYTTAVITALIVGLFIFFTIRPTFQKIANLNKEIKEKEEFRAKINSKLNRVQSLLNKQREVSEGLIYFQEDFSKKEKSGFVVANLAAIADKFEVDLMNINFGDPVDEDEMVELDSSDDVVGISVSVNLEGDTKSIEEFIQYLEGFPKIIDVRNVSYSKNDLSTFDEDLEEFKSIRSSVNMYIYYWKGNDIEEVDATEQENENDNLDNQNQ